HPEINTLGDLLDMINRIREVSGLPTGFKAVIGAYGWLDEFCRLIHERGIESAPDFITIDSGDGGTGAAPMPLMDEMGLPIRESLPMVVNKLNEYGLRSRIRVIASGKRVTPSEVAWALCAGADAVNSARGFMFALGCIQAMRCNRNTCPTGVTTHDKDLQRALVPEKKSVRVANYAKNMVKEVSIIAHSCGVPEPRKLRRYHARIVSANGLSLGLNELHPEVETRPEYRA
ncbi:MAG: FMN-binding glutamate synthase family protein, partial [Xanthomonadales bacterium]|nr:FMN-binding glutamate synthase family protein [Xanthomonadales bacterium]